MNNLRAFFKDNAYYGKLLGGCFGYLMAGPSGALLGVLIGNVFDRGLSKHLNRPYWEAYHHRHSPHYALFLETTFLTLGYIAKVDGRVSEADIRYAQHLMTTFRLTAPQQQAAKLAFERGKQPDFDLPQALLCFQHAMRPTSKLLLTFLTIQYQAAHQEGISPLKQQVLNHIFTVLGYAPLEEQFHHYAHTDSFTHHYHTPPHASGHPASLAQAYATLEIPLEASQAVVKKAYRRLIHRHHPDKLIAQKKSEAEIKIANAKTQAIRKAYETICQARGW